MQPPHTGLAAKLSHVSFMPFYSCVAFANFLPNLIYLVDANNLLVQAKTAAHWILLHVLEPFLLAPAGLLVVNVSLTTPLMFA